MRYEAVDGAIVVSMKIVLKWCLKTGF